MSDNEWRDIAFDKDGKEWNVGDAVAEIERLRESSDNLYRRLDYLLGRLDKSEKTAQKVGDLLQKIRWKTHLLEEAIAELGFTIEYCGPCGKPIINKRRLCGMCAQKMEAEQ